MKIIPIVTALMCMLLLSSCSRAENIPNTQSTTVQADTTAALQTVGFSFDGTVFHYGDHDYDLSDRVETINSIVSILPAGNKIVIQCHVGPKNGIYCIFDTESQTFDDDIRGNNLIWHDDDITTAVYSFGSGIYAYDGSLIKSYELTDSAYIYDLAFDDHNTRLNVTIFRIDDDEMEDTIALSDK